MIHFPLYRLIAIFTIAIFTFSACVDQEFDEPPVRDLSELKGNATIDDLKSLHALGASSNRVEQDWVISALVVADDRSGNFYRQIAIQDETGGIILRLTANGLYNDFPVGTRILVRCQGLYIGDYNNLYQINGSADNGIEELLIDQHVFVEAREQTVTPKTVTIAELNNPATFNALLSTLVRFENVQFVSASAGAPYADAINQASINHTIEDCDGNTLVLRSSGFADFAAALTPTGNGSLVAILSVFGTTKQLTIRDLNDVSMTAERCGGGTGSEDLIAIAQVRSLFTGSTTAAPDNKKIQGIVISDKDNDNWTSRNLVIQDGQAGIVVRFDANHNFSLGDEIEVVISGQELSEFNGLLQVNNVPLAGAKLLGKTSPPEPRVTTVAQVKANLESWESTLVRINAVTLSGSATYNGSITVTDPSGTVVLFTRSAASFAGASLAAGQVDLVAVVSQFNDAQLIIRNLDDVIGGGVVNPENISTLELRTLFGQGASKAPAGKKIRGVVISDKDNANTTTRNLILQDANGGIVVRFTADHNFALGEELEIVVSDQELSEFNGLLQVNNVPNNLANSFGPGTLPTPREATIQQILANMAGDQSWESTLVKITNVTIQGGGTYSGSKTLNDGTGNIVMFTRTQATFANTNVPAAPVTIVAMVSQFNDPQVNIRNLNDVIQ